MSDAENTTTEDVRYEQNGRVAIITMARAKQMNSLTWPMWQRVADFIAQANADKSVGSIVLTGEGRAFSVGGDMNELFLPKMRGEDPYVEEDQRLGGLGLPFDWIRILRDSKPVIAAVNGLAVGGGATMILPCDVIIAAEEASFSFMFAKLGIVAEMGSSHYLAARVGYTQASEILLSARAVDSAEALNIGLINRVVAADQLLQAAIDCAAAIAENPAPMLKLNKQLLDANHNEQDIDAIWQRESDALRECFTLPEHKEAVNAFLEKRKPNFDNA